MKILIIGKNFGLDTHYAVLKNFIKKPKIFLSAKTFSRFQNNFNTIKCYKSFLLTNNVDLITCCTNTLEQQNFINFFIDKKIKTKFLMLEKPIATKIKYIKKINKYCLRNKISLNVNFSFYNINAFNFIKKKLLIKKNLFCNYQLYFKHNYFSKKKNIWKNFSAQGGGINFYYLIHVYFLFCKIFNKIKLHFINYNLNKNKIIYKFMSILKDDNKNIIKFDVNMNSSTNLNKLTFYNKKQNILEYNFKDWHGRCSLKIIDTKKNKINKIFNCSQNIKYLTKINYKNLLKNISLKSNSAFINPIINAHRISIEINRIIKKYDFKKM